MTIATFDTHRIVKRLTDAGLSETAAETVTDVLRESREADLSALATKADLAALRRDVEAVGQDLRKEMQLLEQRLTIKLGSMIVVAVGVVAAS